MFGVFGKSLGRPRGTWGWQGRIKNDMLFFVFFVLLVLGGLGPVLSGLGTFGSALGTAWVPLGRPSKPREELLGLRGVVLGGLGLVFCFGPSS